MIDPSACTGPYHSVRLMLNKWKVVFEMAATLGW